MDEDNLNQLRDQVWNELVKTLKFKEVVVPDDEDDHNPAHNSSILVSANFETSEKAVMIIQNSVGMGHLLGILSRSICLDEGVEKGSVLPYVRNALELGYSVVIVRPNTNSYMEGGTKKYIRGNETPEAHVLFCWDNIICKVDVLKRVVLIGYGGGSTLCKDVFLRDLASPSQAKIAAILTMNASQFFEDDDSIMTKDILVQISANLECASPVIGSRLNYRKVKLGCETFSVGLPPGFDPSKQAINDAFAIHLSVVPVKEFLRVAIDAETSKRPLVQLYGEAITALGGIKYDGSSIIRSNPNPLDDLYMDLPDVTDAVAAAAAAAAEGGEKKSIFSRISSMFRTSTGGGSASSAYKSNGELGVNDFDLLKVVGKGAFGKVMLVRKRQGSGEGSGQIYAMKVLKKSVVAAKGQIEHTKSERDILCAIDHPFIVQLRFAFQSKEKLYLVTDYYNSGNLFFHLRKATKFPIVRSKFYACELLSALSHLHEQSIIYRDLKLENILMHHSGHIALTDFGLSKQGIDSSGGATTFCGTAEYLAPELLKNQAYGPAVDWWSFGILLFEMIEGSTPFYDKNRKTMFYNIIAKKPAFTERFTQEAQATITGLLTMNDSQRLGATSGGVTELKESPFFKDIDFGKVDRKELPPPFLPDVSGELDTKYVPKVYLMAQAEDSFCAPDHATKQVDENFNDFAFAGAATVKKQQDEAEDRKTLER